MSAGSVVGKFIGNTAAYTYHGACVAVNATGRFGADVAAATAEQYAIKSAELAARRDAAVTVAAPKVTRQRKVGVATA